MNVERLFVSVLARRLRVPLNFIQVVLGPRQVGKTTGLQQIVRDWTGPSVMVSADDVAPPSSDWIDLHWKIARAKGPGTLLVIDEVQKVPGWSAAIKRLFDEKREQKTINVVLLGSASLAIQRGLADSLAGRYEVLHADHWSFSECKQAFGWDLNQYLKFGGYPAAAELIDDIPRWKAFINQSIIEPVLLKDLLAVTPVSKPALFRQAFLLSLRYPAMEVSLQKLLGQLQESGNVTTIKHYLEIFEGAYLIKTLQKFSGSEVRKKGSSPKIVPLNTGLVNAQGDPGEVDRNPEWFGRLFECAVGAALCRQADELYYWRDGRDEVDYVAVKSGCCYAIEVKSGRPRRTSGLAKFVQRYPQAIPIILDRDSGAGLLAGERMLDD